MTNDRQSNSSNKLKKFLNKPKTSLKILEDAVHSVQATKLVHLGVYKTIIHPVEKQCSSLNQQ